MLRPRRTPVLEWLPASDSLLVEVAEASSTRNAKVVEMLQSHDRDPDPAGDDWLLLGDLARAHRVAYDAMRSLTAHADDADQLAVLAPHFGRIESRLFPWLGNASSLDRAASAAGRGIAITTGTKYALVAKLAITAIRRLGSPLPIEVFFCGDDDLAAAERAMLAALPGVAVVDMRSRLAITDCQRSWGNKPFAALASSFREVILMDADTMFVQPPDVLFGMRGYSDTGALLFRDRTLAPGLLSHGYGITALICAAAEPFQDQLLYGDSRVVHRRSSSVEIDSGVVVWDKARVMPVVLLTCLFNSQPFRDVLYTWSHGDKESFWIAHETLRIPFVLAPGYGGAIGTLEYLSTSPSTRRVCGGLFHVDDRHDPLWFNGGIGVRTPTRNLRLAAPSVWAIDYAGENVLWEFKEGAFCLRVDGGVGVGVLKGGEVEIVRVMVELGKELFQL
nr:hypothetical protein HK105_002868 [Polyrhizophydium stewartii]